VSQQTNWVPTSVDLEKPSSARVYDYALGGSHNFAVDREWVKQVDAAHPEYKYFALLNRAYLRRAVMHLMEQGIRQFLDLGSGIPTVGNVHEIAQSIDPSARVVYVDIEHVAVAHSQLLLEMDEVTEAMQKTQNALRPRSKAEISEFFGDWELVEPGIVMLSQWRPDRDAEAQDVAEQRDGLYAGVARKR
jgi:S-adenosyl methyltransferase